MIFTDIAYFIFLAIVALLYRFAPREHKPWIVTASGIAFYAYYATGFVWLLAAETLAVYALTTRKTRFAHAAALALPLAVLGYYKYSGFAYGTVAGAGLLPKDNPFMYIAFPLAISFFTFEFLHYSFDYFRGRVDRASLKEFLAFAFFFPSMAAGPIKRFQDFSAQLREAPPAGAKDAFAGCFRILVGLFKKLVLADSLGYFSSVLASGFYIEHASPYQVWFALLAFTFKVYFDFSGYTDIAIGSARLFGLRIPENFDYPFLTRNIAQFWRKWHMSLWSWLNDYVFTPLSLRWREYRMIGVITAVLAVFILSGIWHGADWNFIAWGAFHGVAVALYYVYTRTLKPRLSNAGWYNSKWANAAAVLFNFLVVTVSFSLFAAPLPLASAIMQKLFFLG